jgi:predicted N-acyltransferase
MFDNYTLRTLSFEMFDSIDLIDKEKWEYGLEKEDYYMKHDFLKITERTARDIHSYYYMMVFKDGVKVANIALFIVELDFLNLVGNSAKKIISRIRKLKNNSFFIKTLFCGLPISTVDNSIRIFNKQLTNEILNFLDSWIKEITRKEDIQIVFCKDFSDDDLKWTKCLEKKSYKLIPGLPSNNLIIRWDSFDQYVNNLTKKYRNPLKKILKKRNELTIDILNESESVFNDKFFELYDQVNSSSEFQLEKLKIGFFKEILNNKNLSTKLVTIKKDGVLVGHVSLVEKNDILIPLFLGYDKKLNREFNIYFNLVYMILEIAIQEKKKIIKFGQTADFFKRKMGCISENVWWFIYISSPIIRPFTEYIFGKLFPKVEEYKFEIFKKNKSIMK